MPISQKKINVCVAGGGQIAREVHIPLLKDLGLNVVCICDSQLDVAHRIATGFGISKVYQGLDEAIDSEELDLIDICTPPQTHYELALQALRKRVSCIVEKPLALTTNEAESLMAATNNGAKLYPIQNYSFTPSLIKAKSIVKKGEIGRPVNVSIRYFASFEDHRHKHFLDKSHWIHGLKGDVFSDLLPHLSYMLLEFIGKPVNFKALCHNVSGSPNVIGDELQVAVASEAAVGSISLSYASSLKTIFIEIVGERGGIRIDGNSQTVIKMGVVSDSRSVLARGLEAFSEFFQMSEGLLANMGRTLVGQYKPVTYPHAYLFKKVVRNIVSGEPYPVDVHLVVMSVNLNEKIFEEIDKRPNIS